MANITAGITLNIIITAGDFNDGTRYNGQLSTWDCYTLALQNFASWYSISNIKLNSVSVDNYSIGTNLDIFSYGGCNGGIGIMLN